MPVRVQCPDCLETFNVSDEKIGKRVRCRGCGHPIAVKARSRRKKKKPAPNANVGLWIGLGIGGVVLVAGGIIAGMMFTQDDAPQPVNPVANNDPEPAEPTSPETSAVDEGTSQPAPVESPSTPMQQENTLAKEDTPEETTSPASSIPPKTVKKPEEVPWSVTADPGDAIEWTDNPRWEISYDGNRDRILYPLSTNRFVLLGGSSSNLQPAIVYDLTTGKGIGGFKSKPEYPYKVALSPDGKLSANLRLKPTGQIEIWDLTKGEKVKEFNVIKSDAESVSDLAFRAPGQLVCWGFDKSQGIQSWIRFVDVETEEVKSAPAEGINFNEIAFTPGGRYLISQTVSREILAFDCEAVGRAGKLPLPQNDGSGNSFSAEGFALNSTGDEIAVLLSSRWETRVAFIDVSSGNVSGSIRIPGQIKRLTGNHVLFSGRQLQYMRSDDYLLISGQVLVHRPSERVVWVMEVLPSNDTYQLTNNDERRVIGNDLAIPEGAANAPRLKPRKVDFDKIEQALAVVESSEPAKLSPANNGIQVNIEVASVRFGEPAETKEKLTEVLKDRLEFDGFQLNEDSSAILTVFYAEGAGHELMLSRHRPGSLPTRQNSEPTGQKVESTKALLGLELKIDGQKVWEKGIELNPSIIFFRGDVSDEGARQKVFEEVQEALFGTAIAWYVSEDKKVILPLEDELENPSRLSPTRPTRPRR